MKARITYNLERLKTITNIYGYIAITGRKNHGIYA
jgi:hypothetical protein